MKITRISKLYARFPVTATTIDGQPTTPSVAVALLPPLRKPTAATTWTDATVENGYVTVLLAGPDADPADALVVPPGGADLWARAVDALEVDAVRVERITLG